MPLASSAEATVSPLQPGAQVQLVTETFPDVSGADFAIGGGPTLVRDGKDAEVSLKILVPGGYHPAGRR